MSKLQKILLLIILISFTQCKLKAYEVKEIILASGVAYNIDVALPQDYGKKEKLVPFKSLSKTGKIVNAYNALLLAKHYKQWKKGKWKM